MTELVNYRYLIKHTGTSFSNAQKMLRENIKRADSGSKGVMAFYKKSDVDILIKQFKDKLLPLAVGEWLISDIADHFKISMSTAHLLVKNDDFPRYKRHYSPKNGGKYFRVWNAEKIEPLKISQFIIEYPNYQCKKVKDQSIKPFSWTRWQALFIKICRPGGLLSGNF